MTNRSAFLHTGGVQRRSRTLEQITANEQMGIGPKLSLGELVQKRDWFRCCLRSRRLI